MITWSLRQLKKYAQWSFYQATGQVGISWKRCWQNKTFTLRGIWTFYFKNQQKLYSLSQKSSFCVTACLKHRDFIFRVCRNVTRKVKVYRELNLARDVEDIGSKRKTRKNSDSEWGRCPGAKDTEKERILNAFFSLVFTVKGRPRGSQTFGSKCTKTGCPERLWFLLWRHSKSTYSVQAVLAVSALAGGLD